MPTPTAINTASSTPIPPRISSRRFILGRMLMDEESSEFGVQSSGAAAAPSNVRAALSRTSMPSVQYPSTLSDGPPPPLYPPLQFLNSKLGTLSQFLLSLPNTLAT